MIEKYNPDHIRQLVQEISEHRRLYYAGTPKISDQRYDALEAKLKELNPEHPILHAVGSYNANGDKVAHLSPMLSLEKTYDVADLISWLDNKEAMACYKIDGVSLSLIYSSGKLTLAKTRGNGKEGEDVSAKIKWVCECVPKLNLPEKLLVEDLEIRGELYCSYKNFHTLSLEMRALKLEEPSSPRNIVAGVLSRKQWGDLAKFFSFFAFDVAFAGGKSAFASEEEKMSFLKKQHFNLAVPKLIKNEKELRAYLAQALQFTEDGDYSIDGVVLTFNEVKIHAKLGVTSHHPKYRLSYKWAGETVISTIREIIWNTSRLGVVTPVARIEAVYLSGAQIQNVTLHNAAHVESFNLKSGDKIEIIRSGEVIPKFLKLVEANQQGHCQIASNCPTCKSSLEFDGVRLLCLNKECPAQQSGMILNWIRCAKIEDLSEKRLMALLESGLVQHPADLYKLSEEDFLKLPLTKEKMAKKLVANIEKSKKISLPLFLSGIGIKGMGARSWEVVLENYPSLSALRLLDVEELQKIKGFAYKTAQAVVDGLIEKANDMELLLKAGVEIISYQQSAEKKHSFFGKNMVITGSLSKPRNEIEELLKNYGVKLQSAVSAKTDVVISNDASKGSTKLKKALELNIPIWNEEELNKKIREG